MALEAWLGYNPSLCVFNETCGDAMAIEHNGDLYSCDHYVTPDYYIGNIEETPIADMVDAPFQRKFGTDKRDTLPEYCRNCDVKFVCNGGCPKNRIIKTPDGEDGLNYLCAGYKHFFTHIDEPMKLMASALQAGKPANSIIPMMREQRQTKSKGNNLRTQTTSSTSSQKIGRNSPCPCGSGRKYKQCCLGKNV